MSLRLWTSSLVLTALLFGQPTGAAAGPLSDRATKLASELVGGGARLGEQAIRSGPAKSSRQRVLLGAAIGAGVGTIFGVALARGLDGESPAKVMITMTGVFAAIGAAVGYRMP